ncbi:phage adaptor protein [Pararhizobium qamdonense]|uniref:phage adaptor protein n=1 Tax=Pararhizobium qamdonense TaxID=3031126 RepID=UPI0023E24EC1|nr:hypothetical protein [Pararhizobium qamdonense]
MTYDEFIEQIDSYTIRTDAPIAAFITRAESSLRTIVKHYLAEKTVTLNVAANRATLPSDFREIRTITGSAGITYRPIAPMNAVLQENEVGYYRDGNSIVFVGSPDSSIGFQYSSAFPDLTATQSNWLFERFPNVYIAAVLKSFYEWTKDPEGVQIEQAALNEALSIVAEDDRRGRVTGTIIMGASSW